MPQTESSHRWYTMRWGGYQQRWLIVSSARLTAGFLLLATQLLGRPIRRAWRVWYRDAWQTASPNAGQPMSVMAGALGVELAKVGYYCLGAGQAPPTAQHISVAVRLV